MTFGRRARRVALPIATALVMGLSGGQIIAASMADLGIASCGPVDSAGFSESQAFVPYEATRTKLPSIPIASLGSPIDQLAEKESGRAIGGLAARWIVRTDTGSTYRYFFGSPLDAGLTPEEFWAQGGIQLDMDPLADELPFWQSLRDQFPTLVNPVKIGQHDGVVVWADPASNGVRTHNVYWSDGRYNYGLIADRPVATVVDLARDLACSR